MPQTGGVVLLSSYLDCVIKVGAIGALEVVSFSRTCRLIQVHDGWRCFTHDGYERNLHVFTLFCVVAVLQAHRLDLKGLHIDLADLDGVAR